MDKAVISHKINKVVRNQIPSSGEDYVIIEEPLEIFIASPTLAKPKSSYMVTMRTPGQDYELVCGILFNLGIITKISEILDFRCTLSSKEKTEVLVTVNQNYEHSKRQTFINSSCGVCNFANWDDVAQHSLYPIMSQSLRINTETLMDTFATSLHEKDYFTKTGGNHKVSLFDVNGRFIDGAEDVGRHNAFDKLIGQALMTSNIPLSEHLVVLSGRCSFEMCQKAWLAGIPLVASIGAPTSKAIDLAENAGITLVGFLKKDSFNIYTHTFRISS